MNGRRLAIAVSMLSPYWHEVFDRLASLGWTVQVFVAADTEKNRFYEPADYSGYRFSVKRNRSIPIYLGATKSRSEYLHLQWGLWPDLVRFRPDVILSNQLSLRTLIAMVYGKVHSIPVVPWMAVSRKTEENNSRLRELYRGWILRHSATICTNLTEGKRYLKDNLGIREEQLFYAPYAIDVRQYNAKVVCERACREDTRRELGIRGFVLLYVGQMIGRKGIVQLGDALGTLSPANRARLSLLMVGGDLPPEGQSALDRSGVSFTSVPFVQPAELPKYYAAADAFVFPSLADEWGIVINEALASGLPIVASPHAGATADLVRDGVNGIVADPLEPSSFGDAILRISQLSELQREQWSVEALTAASDHDLDKTVEQMHMGLIRALGVA